MTIAPMLGSVVHAAGTSIRRWRIAAVLLVAACVPALHGAPVAEPTLVIDRALAAISDAERFPFDAVAVPVPLPDRWSASRPGYSGTIWYHAVFALPAAIASEQIYALYIERACSNVQLRLNGFLVFSGGRMVEPVTRNCSRPQFVTLPTALLHPGENALDIRLVGYAQERVGSVEAAASLSAIEFGNQSILRARHAAHYFWTVTWTDATSLLLIGIGCVLLAVGWLNKREVYFAYLGWLCLAWVAVSIATMAREMPWSNDASEFMLTSVWAVLLALAVQFFLSFAGRRSRMIEVLVALQWVLLPLTLLIAGAGNLFDVARFWYTTLAFELGIVMTIYIAVTRGQRPRDLWLMGPVVAGGAVSVISEVAAQWGLANLPTLSLGRLFLPVAFSAVGARLLLMFARALRATEDDRNRVVGQLHRLTAEMQTRVEQLTAQRVGQFTELERKRIASDLHDDLGAKLLTIVHTVDATRLPQLAREALEEMRLSVRGLAGKPIQLDDAVADWRAEVVGRLEQAGIQCSWVIQADPASPALTARTYMQMTRIIRESVSNIIKHSGAKHVQVGCIVADARIRMKVRDDGRGITGDLASGQGVASMKRRAKRLSGQCLVESRPGHGVVISLTVPI